MSSILAFAHLADIQAGPVTISPRARAIRGPAGEAAVEPLVMQLLVELAQRAGAVVSRERIFELCWGGAAVGDDSLNRVVAQLRKALEQAAPGLAVIETAPRTGYRLRLTGAAGPGEGVAALAAAQASLRLGMPAPDLLRLEMLRRAIAAGPVDEAGLAALLGMSALLSRVAAEYADHPADTSDFVARCEADAARALAIEPGQVEARVALATVAPLQGRWTEARSRLSEICEDAGGAFLPWHELAIVEMASGCVSRALSIINPLIAADPLAATLHYKAVYQRWSAGDLAGAEQVAERAIQLWPAHPAVWTCRFWTLGFTGRPQAALQMLEEGAARPPFPAPALKLFRAAMEAKASGAAEAAEAACGIARMAAKGGPVGAIAALFTLGLLERPEAQAEVAFGYYLREGADPTPVRRGEGELSVNEQHRRVTQILFTPACAPLRGQPRFLELCERIGLAAHWRAAGVTPDFLL